MTNGRSVFEQSKYAECFANLANDRIIFISEDITKNVSSSLSALLLHYDNINDQEDISIYINTYGGDVSALSNIYDIMQMIKSPIKTVCIGKAYSAGSFILAAGTKGKRFITKNSSVMIHGMQCSFPGGDGVDQRVQDSQIYFDFLTSLNKSILEILAKHTNKTYEQVFEDCKKDNFLDASDALKYGIVDFII